MREIGLILTLAGLPKDPQEIIGRLFQLEYEGSTIIGKVKGIEVNADEIVLAVSPPDHGKVTRLNHVSFLREAKAWRTFCVYGGSYNFGTIPPGEKGNCEFQLLHRFEPM